MAVNCCVVPRAIEGFACVTAIEDSTGGNLVFPELEPQPEAIRQTLRAQIARKTPHVRLIELEFVSISTTS
jgi:hypothetical protein